MKPYTNFPLSFLLALAFLCLTSAQSDYKDSTTETEHVSVIPHEGVKTDIAVFVASLTTVFIGGLGDKTFLIAAFMSMKFPGYLIFTGAAGALFIILGASAAFGAVVPDLIPSSVIHVGIIILFFFFGFKFLYEAYTYEDKIMVDEQEKVTKQIKLVESKLQQTSPMLLSPTLANKRLLSDDIEMGKLGINKITSTVSEQIGPKEEEEPTPEQPPSQGNNSFALKRSILLESFSLIFCAEWGDRSQLYTIALASEYPPFFVFLGGFLGHLTCIIIAIIGGKYIADKLSEKTILYIAGVLYLVLAVVSIFD